MAIDLGQLIHTYGYTGMFIISTLESGIFFLLPGDSLLFTAGILSSSGYLNVIASIAVFFTGSLLGSLCGYEIGKRLEYLQKFKIFKYILRDKYIKEAHVVFQNVGDKIMLFNRFVPLVRTFAPMVAGLVSMNYSKFVFYNVLGSGLWSISIVSAGYFLGREFPFIEQYLSLIMIGILVVTVVPVIYKIVSKYKTR